jgi:hypothetical protein
LRRATQISDWPKKLRVSGSTSLETGSTYLSKIRICALTAELSSESCLAKLLIHHASQPIGLK